MYLLNKKKEPVSELSISRIRELALNDKDRSRIEEFILSKAEKLVDAVEKSFIDAGVPSFIKMKIVSEKTDIYLLLLYLAQLNSEINLASLALFLYWFSKDARNARKCIAIILNEVFKFLKIKSPSVDIQKALKKGISRANCKATLYCVETPESLWKVKESLKEDKDIKGDVIKIADLADYVNYKWLSFWQVIAKDSTNTFLLYAQKDYINETFTRYNPADLRNWESHDRPWDYDHIIPKSWIESRRGGIRNKVKYWIWTTGNFAAIPFSENRSKSNSEDSFGYYEDNSDKLLFDSRFNAIDKNSLLEDDCANMLATVVFDRTIRIYEKCYSTIKEWIPSVSNLDEDVQRRKRFVEKIQNEVNDTYGLKGLREPDIYYYDSTADWDHESSAEERAHSFVWSSPYLTVGIPGDNDAFIVGFTWGLEGDGSYEIGLRERKGVQKGKREFNYKLKEFCDEGDEFEIEPDTWWHLRKIYDAEPKKDVVLDDLRKLLKAFKDMLKS